MSRFSEKRLAADLANVVQDRDPHRRRRDIAVIAFTLCGGLIGNFVFNKIEIAAALWTFTLAAFADYLLSWGKLAAIGGSKRFMCDAIIVGVIWWATYPIAASEYREQHAALFSGTLRARRDGKDHSREQPIVQIGTGSTRFTWPNVNTPMMGGPADKIKVVRDGNDLKLSTTVRDSAGNLIVEIVNNDWRVSKSETNCWDKNYTDDSLEVKDGRGRVVLQVRLLPDRVELQAEYPDGDSGLLEVGFYNKEDGITPVFKYPSNEHWQEIDPRSGYHQKD
jgi:hypothetical protein